MSIQFTIYGEPASKANSRQLVTNARTKRPMFIKSGKARDYEAAVKKQVRPISPLLTGPLSITATIYYRTRRPDLDESIILDALQGLIYENDRQIREKHIYHGINKENPRTEIEIRPIGDDYENAARMQ